MFANGELDFTMSNNDGEVDNKVRRGLFPASARAYVLDSGTIQNSHYLGIVHNAPHLEGALVAIDFLVSPAAQLEKAKPDAVATMTNTFDHKRVIAGLPQTIAPINPSAISQIICQTKPNPSRNANAEI